jgi:phosphate transport system substrate-binding protein
VSRRTSIRSPKASIPISRPLFFYVKKAHVDVIPASASTVSEVHERCRLGDFGYLSDKGLVPPENKSAQRHAKDAGE